MDNVRYILSADTLDAELVAVTGFAGSEALSVPFDFRLDFCATGPEPLPFADLPGKPATLSFTPPHGRERHVNGRFAHVESLGNFEGRLRYRCRLVPRLAELGLNRRCRIFQKRSTLDIVKAVLTEGGVEHRVAVSGSYEPREFCVQYGESDLRFVRRLLEEEGIFFYFEHSATSHVLVLMDAVTACPTSDSVLPFRGETGEVTAIEHVSRFTSTRRLRPGKVVLRDFNFLTPHADLTGAAAGEGTSADMERYEHPGGYAAAGAGAKRAKVRLEEEQGDSALHEAESDAAGLLPGYGFDVTEHPVPELDGAYLVVSITHHGDDRLYRNQAICIPADQPWRPPRAVPRPVAPGVQTAMVVGPEGEEIHTDEHGRIKVQFHWDREGATNDQSSCWMRVSQAWAGAGFGALYIPRIGHEVIVRFIDGDPDRPIVIGGVYNGVNTPPITLPAEKTKSTLRSSSSPGGAGSNELRFEDQAGREQIYAHAQKDEEIVVENDKQQEVRAIEHLTVKKDRSREVHQNQTLTVHGEDLAVVDKNQSLTVKGHRSTVVAGALDEEVGANQSVTVTRLHRLNVAQDSNEEVGVAKALTVGGALGIAVGQGIEVEVSGPSVQAVGGRHEEWVLGSREEKIDKDFNLTVGGKLVIDLYDGGLTIKNEKDAKGEVGGDETWTIKEESQWSTKKLELKADTLSFVVNDKKLLSMAKSGEIKLAAKNLIIDGSAIKAKGKTIDMVAAGSAPSGKAKEAKPEKLKTKDKKIAKGVSFKMASASGDPTAGLKFEATLPDGTKVEGKLTSSGEASISGIEKGDVKIEFPELDEKEWKSDDGGKSGDG